MTGLTWVPLEVLASSAGSPVQWVPVCLKALNKAVGGVFPQGGIRSFPGSPVYEVQCLAYWSVVWHVAVCVVGHVFCTHQFLLLPTHVVYMAVVGLCHACQHRHVAVPGVVCRMVRVNYCTASLLCACHASCSHYSMSSVGCTVGPFCFRFQQVLLVPPHGG